MKHAIPAEQAKKMTALYRQNKEKILSDEYKGKDILSLSETFDAESFRSLLANAECKQLRIYFGMDDNLKVHLITVGVNSEGAEILEGENSILEDGAPCPPYCPPPPPPPSLN